MALNYNIPRQAPPKPGASNTSRYALKRQAPLTQGARLAEDQNTQGLATGKFADVQSAQGATERANALRTSQGLQAARGTVARAGDFSPEAALRAQDQAFAAASAQNLNATNGVNQLQRQYRNDAQVRAGEFEANAQKSAIGERDYQTSRDDTEFNRTTDATRYGDSRTDKAFDQTLARDQFGAGREDAATQKNQFGETLAQRQQEFGVSSGQTQQQINNQAGQFLSSLNQRNNEFGVTSGQNQQQIDNQKDQFGQTLADSKSRFDLTRQDSNSQFAQTFGANREDAATAKDQFSQTFGANREDAATAKDQFSQTFGANREDAATAKDQFAQTFGANRADTEWNQNNTVAQQADSRSRFDLTRQDTNSQFAQTFGANREDAATAKDQFGQTLAQRKDEFGVTSGQNQQQIDNQVSQFGVTSGQNQEQINNQKDQFGQTMAQRKDEFGVTSGQNQQQIDNQVDQFGQTYAAGREDAATQKDQFGQTLTDSRSRFDLTRQDANAQQTLDNTRYDQTYADQRGDINYNRTEANRLEGKGDELAAINNIADPKAKQAAYNAYMNGEDVSQFITGNLYDQYGGLKVNPETGKSDYASASPAEATAAAKVEELKSYYPKGANETPEAYDARMQQMALDERNQDRTLARAPAEAALKEQQIQAIQEKDRQGLLLTPDEEKLAIASGTYKEFTPANIPTGSNATPLAGQKVNIGGSVYTVVNGSRVVTEKGGTFSSDRHKDFTIIKDQTGKTLYVVDGKITSSRPTDNNTPSQGLF